MENTNLPQTEKKAPENDGDDRPSLFKQILGAVVGGGLALALYYGYEYAKPQVTAYLTLPVAEGGRLFDLGASSIADKSLEDNERKRFVSKNLQAANMIENRETAYNDHAAADDHSLDIDWPGHEAQQQEVAMQEEEMEEDMVDEEMKQRVHEEQMATKNMAMEDDWDSLWGDIRDRENDDEEVGETSNAPALPDSGFGLGFLTVGAVGGALGARKKKKQ